MECLYPSSSSRTRTTADPNEIYWAYQLESEGKFEQAFKAWKALANNNKEPNALYRCGLMLLTGIGTERNQKLGMGYLGDAAKWDISEAVDLFQNRFNNPPEEIPFEVQHNILDCILRNKTGDHQEGQIITNDDIANGIRDLIKQYIHKNNPVPTSILCTMANEQTTKQFAAFISRFNGIHHTTYSVVDGHTVHCLNSGT